MPVHDAPLWVDKSSMTLAKMVQLFNRAVSKSCVLLGSTLPLQALPVCCNPFAGGLGWVDLLHRAHPLPGVALFLSDCCRQCLSTQYLVKSGQVGHGVFDDAIGYSLDNMGALPESTLPLQALPVHFTCLWVDLAEWTFGVAAEHLAPHEGNTHGQPLSGLLDVCPKQSPRGWLRLAHYGLCLCIIPDCGWVEPGDATAPDGHDCLCCL